MGVLKFYDFYRLCSKHQDQADTQEDDFTDVSYQLARNTMTTNYMDTLPRGTLPMSTIMQQLNRRSSDEENMPGNFRQTSKYRKRWSKLKQRSKRNTENTGRSQGRKRWTSQQFTWNSYKHYLSQRLGRKKSQTEQDTTGTEEESTF